MRNAMMTLIVAAVSSANLFAGEPDVVEVVETLLRAPLAGESERKEQVLQALGNAESAASASALVQIVVHGAAGKAFAELPADIQQAVRNTLAAHPDDATKARALAAINERHDVPAQTVEELERVQHPRVLALLTVEARDRGDVTRTAHLTSVLEGLDDPRVMEAYAVLAEQEVLSVYEANDRAYALALRLGEAFHVDSYAPALSDFESTPQARSVAAFALAGAHRSSAAHAALEKALAHTTAPEERRNLKAALTLLAAREATAP